MDTSNTLNRLSEVATRIKDLREVMSFSVTTMAKKTNVSEAQYISYESGKEDIFDGNDELKNKFEIQKQSKYSISYITILRPKTEI